MLIKLLVSALLLVQTSSFAAAPSVRGDTDTLLAFNDGAPTINRVTPATEPETEKLIMIGLALMGVIAFRHKGVT